jgi:hypothetical protein
MPSDLRVKISGIFEDLRRGLIAGAAIEPSNKGGIQPELGDRADPAYHGREGAIVAKPKIVPMGIWLFLPKSDGAFTSVRMRVGHAGAGTTDQFRRIG